MLMEILLSYVIPALVPVVVGVAVAFLRKLSRKIDADIAASTTDRVLGKTAALAATVVAAVEQAVRPVVQEALKDGALSEKEREEIKDFALTRLKQYIGPEGLSEVAKLLGLSVVDHAQVDRFLGDHIEAAVLRLKTRE